MAKGGRSNGKGKGKGKEKASICQPNVVGRTSPQVGSTHTVEQTVDPTDRMQPILDSTGGKLAVFLKSVEQETALATKDPILNKQQSFEAIQTMLHVSLTYICYLRDLLPPAAFNVRNLACIPNNIHWAYHDLVNGMLPQMTIGQNEGFQKPFRMFVLAQERHSGAKKLQSWLDGIFDALSKNVLASLQFSIILDKEKPSEIIESYTFTMKYTRYPDTALRQLVGLTVSPSGGEPITLVNVRSGLETIWKHLSHTVERLPELPSQRYLTIHLFYTDDCDPAYHPPLFKPSNDLEVLVPHSGQWQMLDVDIGQLNTGHHRIALRIGHLVAVDSSETGIEEDIVIPQILHYTRSIARIMNSGTIGVLDKAEPSGSQSNDNMMQRRFNSMKRMSSPQVGLGPTQTIADMAPTPQRKRGRADNPPGACKKTKVDNRSPVPVSRDHFEGESSSI
ncbi:DNA binding protein [Xylographa opegraphella]|nr:DNA binding protein [Xylographa opegraphella]